MKSTDAIREICGMPTGFGTPDVFCAWTDISVDRQPP